MKKLMALGVCLLAVGLFLSSNHSTVAVEKGGDPLSLNKLLAVEKGGDPMSVPVATGSVTLTAFKTGSPGSMNVISV
ncbi:MAG: hypothetical protein ACXVO1_07880 [Tumebacillaceae bacterium]